jgi:hypothetical protein
MLRPAVHIKVALPEPASKEADSLPFGPRLMSIASIHAQQTSQRRHRPSTLTTSDLPLASSLLLLLLLCAMLSCLTGRVVFCRRSMGRTTHPRHLSPAPTVLYLSFHYNTAVSATSAPDLPGM